MSADNQFSILLNKQYDISYINHCLKNYKTYNLDTELDYFELKDAGTTLIYHKSNDLQINVEYVSKTTLQFYIKV